MSAFIHPLFAIASFLFLRIALHILYISPHFARLLPFCSLFPRSYLPRFRYLCRTFSVTFHLRIRNRHNQKPIDILPPPDPSSPESDDELVRAVLRRAEAESMIAASGDVVNGESFHEAGDKRC